MKHILASLGAWLTRRYGSVRPGEELAAVLSGEGPAAAVLGPAAVSWIDPDLTASGILGRLYMDSADGDGEQILLSARNYIEFRQRRRSRGTVAAWFFRDQIDSLIVGRSIVARTKDAS